MRIWSTFVKVFVAPHHQAHLSSYPHLFSPPYIDNNTVLQKRNNVVDFLTHLSPLFLNTTKNLLRVKLNSMIVSHDYLIHFLHSTHIFPPHNNNNNNKVTLIIILETTTCHTVAPNILMGFFSWLILINHNLSTFVVKCSKIPLYPSSNCSANICTILSHVTKT